MGLDAHSLRFLAHAKTKGVSYSSTVTLGRQCFFLKPADLREALGIALPEAAAWLAGTYIEPLLKFHGAERIESLDNSSYEKATIIHDLNQPVPENLKSSFSCVFDGGATEHVFNFPQVIKNCMELVAPGGHYLGVTTANNFMGHGFYQFSPELFYRVFSPENGYEIMDMLLCETDPGAPWYRVQDPSVMGRRMELVNNRPTYILVVARRIREAEIFASTPQQSDYLTAWAGSGEAASSGVRRRGLLAHTKRLLPAGVKTRIKRAITGRAEAFQSDFYRRV